MIKIYDGWSSWPESKRELRYSLDLGRVEFLGDVYKFASGRHEGQRRSAGEPYVEHLLQVLQVLVQGARERDPDLLAAALLRDVVEDTETSSDEIESVFGSRVREVVDWVTQPAPETDRQASRSAYLAHLVDAPREIRLLKLADRLSNVQHLDTHPKPDRQRTYYRETVERIIPLSHDLPWFAEWRRQFAYLGPSMPTTP